MLPWGMGELDSDSTVCAELVSNEVVDVLPLGESMEEVW